MSSSRRYALLLVAVLAWGCSSATSPQVSLKPQPGEGCRQFLGRLDETVARVSVRDASGVPVPGFPYLRSNRFLAALKDQLKSDEEREQWLHLMSALNLESREKEIFNLPDNGIRKSNSGTAGNISRTELITRMESCSNEMLRHDQLQPQFFETLYRSVEVPDEYSSFMRVLGLFPLASMPVAIIGERVENRFRQWYRSDLRDLPVAGVLRFFAPVQGEISSSKDVGKMLEAARTNPLQIPLLSREEEKRLALCYSPVFVQDIAGLYDRFGEVVRDGKRLDIDVTKPTVYYYVSYALLNRQPALQFNYVIWYSDRTGDLSPRIERGHMDGLTVRVSLDNDGEIIMVDMMSNCGCYHSFVPNKKEVIEIRRRSFGLEPFVPQRLPDIPSGERLVIRVNSGWHQVQRLFAADVPGDALRYALIPYATLESFPDSSGRSGSMFNAKGIVEGSERIEPLLMFSMGIPSIGSMRQRGHHAIEITGHAHFDDPRLFDENFIFK